MTRPAAPDLPPERLSLGVTGHRDGHPGFTANAGRIGSVVGGLLDLMSQEAGQQPSAVAAAPVAVRLHSMLAPGADTLLATQALGRGWELVVPLPLGATLYGAVNAMPGSAAEARALLAADPRMAGPAAGRMATFRALCGRASVFELAERDEIMGAAFLAALDNPGDGALAEIYRADLSERIALAARLVIEQSDLLIAIWDGARTTFVGGTGHTVAVALEAGVPVIWIDPAEPEAWRIMRSPEALATAQAMRQARNASGRHASHAGGSAGARDEAGEEVYLRGLVRAALGREGDRAVTHGTGHDRSSVGASSLDVRHWRGHSSAVWHGYRRVEALFGGRQAGRPWRSLRQTYPTPEAFTAGEGAAVLAAARAIAGSDPAFMERLERGVMGRFAWADGISSQLSDKSRGGMMINFVLSACAIIGGVAYLPLTGGHVKWPFALFELVLLAGILAITFMGQAGRWHGRWFETRRVAEYLRLAPVLLALGVSRPVGRWSVGANTSWPEHHARQAMRAAGLPGMVVTTRILREGLIGLLDAHVAAQRDYHRVKARRLSSVHHGLDRLSERMFQVAVLAVAIYLAVFAGSVAGLVSSGATTTAAKTFTFLGVALPTLGGAIAGIRYFGDFERFAAISEVTAGKLAAIHERILLLASAPDAALTYAAVSALVHACDDVVVSEIESWQAVFAGKHITVPV
jgi:hypothetical protein